MLKTLTLATAMSIAAISADADTAMDTLGDLGLPIVETDQATQPIDAYDTAAYCEWVTVYDYWGNWVTLWQCY